MPVLTMTRRFSVILYLFIIAILVNLVILLSSVIPRNTKPVVSSNPTLASASALDNEDLQALQNSEVTRNWTELDFKSLQNLYRSLERQLEEHKSLVSFLSQPIINNHSFPYIHNPKKTCADGKTEVLFVTPSAPGNFENRAKVRNGNRAIYAKQSNGRVRLLFFLGEPSDKNTKKSVQTKINEESSQFGDIVQDGFVDTYANMRFKAVSMLKWASLFCSGAKYVIRSDDDVYVDPEKLISALEKKSANLSNFILGVIAEKWEPIRRKNNKYFLSEEAYPQSTFPNFILGGLMGFPLSTVNLLYQAALRVKPLWLDDVFITGICAVKVNISLVHDPDFVFKHWAW